MMSVKQTVGQDPNKITALYERLSRDDDQVAIATALSIRKNTSKAMLSRKVTLISNITPMTVGAAAISIALHGSSWKQILKPAKLPM